MRKTITTLWIALAALVAFGLVLVYSASVAQKGGAVPFMKMQTVAAAVGLLAAFVLSRLDYRVWQKPACAIALVILCVAASSLVFLFRPSTAAAAGFASRESPSSRANSPASG